MTLVKKNQFEPSFDIEKFKKAILSYGGHTDINIDGLQKVEKEIVVAQNYDLVSEIPEGELKELVFMTTSNALRAYNAKLPAEERVVLVNDLSNELIEEYPRLTVQEFSLIVKNGVRGKYDTETVQTRGLSITNFSIWHECYQNLKNSKAQKIQAAIESDMKKAEKPDTPLKASDFIQIFRANYKAIQEFYLDHPEKNKYTFDDFWLKFGMVASGPSVFDRMEKLEMIDAHLYEQIKSGFDITTHKKKRGKNLRIFANEKLSVEDEIKRIYCCKYVLFLRAKKAQKNGK